MMNTKKNLQILAVVTIIVLFLPLIINNLYYMQILINIGSLTTISLGLTLLLGFAGQISFAQVTFMGIGAYTVGIATVNYGWPPLLALIFAVVLAAVLAALIGLPVLKFQSHYLALITISFGMMFFVLLNQLTNLTGGPGGFMGIQPLSIAGFEFEGEFANYYLIWVVVLVSVLFVINLMNSRTGRALESIKSSEIAAKSMGINVFALKLKVFIFAGVLASIGGALYAFQLSFISPNTFEVLESITLITIVVVGGLRSVWGALIGAVVVTAIELGLTNYLPLIIPNASGEIESIAYGVLLILVFLFMPNGLGPTIAKRFSEGSKKSKPQNENLFNKEIRGGLDGDS